MIGIEPIMIDKKNQETYQSFEPTRTAVKCAVCPCCQASFRFAIRSIEDKRNTQIKHCNGRTKYRYTSSIL